MSVRSNKSVQAVSHQSEPHGVFRGLSSVLINFTWESKGLRVTNTVWKKGPVLAVTEIYCETVETAI